LDIFDRQALSRLRQNTSVLPLAANPPRMLSALRGALGRLIKTSAPMARRIAAIDRCTAAKEAALVFFTTRHWSET
jgi:hypothetical protein